MPSLIKVRDVTLRDGQQSLAGGGMTGRHLARLLPLYRQARFSMVEVWGGAVPSIMMRDLGESPWERLRECSEALKNISLICGVSRGRYLFGRTPYPLYVLESFYKEAFASGLNVMRVFDALNDIENIRDSVRLISEYGGIPDAALCYAADPIEAPAPPAPKKGFLARLFSPDTQEAPPEKVYTDDYFVGKAKEMEALGAKIVTLEDMGGLAAPSRIYSLMPKLKHALKVPVGFHTRCSAGYGLASTLMAILKGVDMIDTNIWWMGGSLAAPPVELIWIFCRRLEISLDVDMEAVGQIRKELHKIRLELLNNPEETMLFPRDFDEAYAEMPPRISEAFDQAIAAATDKREEDLLEACAIIENYFGFPPHPENCRHPELPASMMRRITNRLKAYKEPEIIRASIEAALKVRSDIGLPPLVEPLSAIIADQAVTLAIEKRNGLPEYSEPIEEFKTLVSGIYGASPRPIDATFREKITGNPFETSYDTSTFREPANPELPEFGGVKLARNDEEFLLLELNSEQGEKFLRQLREAEYKEAQGEGMLREETAENS